MRLITRDYGMNMCHWPLNLPPPLKYSATDFHLHIFYTSHTPYVYAPGCVSQTPNGERDEPNERIWVR